MTFAQLSPIPADTARASEEAFGNDHPYIKIGDDLERILSEISMLALYEVGIGLREPFWNYAFATVLQYREGLTDNQMANATRTRTDLKYVLRLPLHFPGFDPSLLCRFRQTLLENLDNRDVFRQIVNQLHYFIDTPDTQLAESDHIIRAICTNNRREIVFETMSNAVEVLATYFPKWLRTVALPSWYKRYYYTQALQKQSNASNGFESIFSSVGKDGQHLLDCVENSGNPKLIKLPEVRTLAKEWQHQFEIVNGQYRLRSAICSDCVSRSQSLFS